MNAIDINKEEKAMNSYRKIASIAGVLLLIGAVTAFVSNGLTDPVLRAPDYLTSISAHGTQIMIGALVAVIEAIASASIAIVLYPVLRKYHEGLALGAVSFGLMKGVFSLVKIIGLLSLVLLSQHFVKAGAPSTSAFQIVGMLTLAIMNWAHSVFGDIALGVSALMYYAVLYQTRLVPRWLAFGGLTGGVQTLAAAVLVMFGFNPLSFLIISSILPLFLQGMGLGGWLIVKGFNPAAAASQSAKPATNEQSSTREVRMASPKVA
jgi:Domain of unknown function (DUF4386)